jgi:hypothetical protein
MLLRAPNTDVGPTGKFRPGRTNTRLAILLVTAAVKSKLRWLQWLGKLNEFNGNFVNAEMVKAFIVSGEYKQRFGP